MKRRSLEEYQRERREQEAQALHTTPGDDERKERVLDHGRECLRRVKGDTTWEDWLGIGAALMVVTEEALAAVGVAVWNPDNKRLVREFNRLWEEYEASAAEEGSNQKPLSKQERWAVREVMTNPAIGAWRSTLDGVNRRKLNHPNRVIDRWKSATQTSNREPKKPVPSMSQALKEKDKVIAELEARAQEKQEERPPLSIDDIIDALVEMWQDQPEGALQVTLNQFSKQLTGRLKAAWAQRRHDDVPTEPEMPKKKKRKGVGRKSAIKQAEDDLNAILGGLMKSE
jgi:hypothetical protein